MLCFSMCSLFLSEFVVSMLLTFLPVCDRDGSHTAIDTILYQTESRFESNLEAIFCFVKRMGISAPSGRRHLTSLSRF